MADKKNRIASLIQKNVSEIIQFELKNPKVGFVTVTDTACNVDHSVARIYVSFMGMPDTEQKFAELKKAKGFIRSSLAKKMDVFKVPELIFLLDDTYDRAKHLEETLAKEAELLAKKDKK
jgi:ribosome-binding factor A